MAPVARSFGMHVSSLVDERRDPEKATRAACTYLKELYERFGSWELALAGYNSGEGRVERAQRKRPSCPDYWCLDLPRETENFVPKFMAALMIGVTKLLLLQPGGLWLVLGAAAGMVAILVWEARDVGLLAHQWAALIVTTVLVAGACVWIIGWE